MISSAKLAHVRKKTKHLSKVQIPVIVVQLTILFSMMSNLANFGLQVNRSYQKTDSEECVE